MVQTGDINFSRWLFYLVFGLPFLVWLAATRKSALRIAAVTAILILIQQTFVARRYLWAIGVGPSVIVAYVAFMASAARRRLPRPIGFVFALWSAFLFCAFIGLVLGSMTPSLLQWNVIAFQIHYLEPCLFFFLGTLAFANDREVENFLVYLGFIGAIVAVVHLFCLATGYRLPNLPDEVALRNEWWSYGGHFTNANTLGHAMAMLIPTSLVVALDRRAATFHRLAVVIALIPMTASLALAGSRGAYLVAAILTVVTVGYSHGTVARALAVAGVGGAAIAGAGLIVSALFPDVWQLIVVQLTEEGLQTPRWVIWSSYLRMLAANPFGIGLDQRNIELVTGQYQLPAQLAHNIYLDLAVRIGILGMLAFIRPLRSPHGSELSGILGRSRSQPPTGEPGIPTGHERLPSQRHRRADLPQRLQAARSVRSAGGSGPRVEHAFARCRACGACGSQALPPAPARSGLRRV